MTIRSTPWPAGSPCWADITVPDLDAAFTFYRAVLGWSFVSQVDPWPDYYIAEIDGHAIAGLAEHDHGDTAVWSLYFACDDANDAVKAIEEHGGTVLVEPHDVGMLGRFAIALDPTGATFSVWQALDHIGAALAAAPGSIVWEDLRSPTPDDARTFYSSVFGFEHDEVDGAPADYQAFKRPGEQDRLGGIGGMFGNDELPAHWIVYFGVADAAAAVTAAEQTGGGVVTPLFDSRFGRMAALKDPAGAVFMIVETPEPDGPGTSV